MFLRAKNRYKDGKVHRYWSVVESRRTADDRVLQRPVLYLGEINDSQKAAGHALAKRAQGLGHLPPD